MRHRHQTRMVPVLATLTLLVVAAASCPLLV